MTTIARLSEEPRLRRRFAVLAALAGLLLFAGAAVQAAGPQPKVQELTVQLLVANQRGGLELVGAVINGLGLLGLGATLAFLFRAVKARKPEISQGTWIVGIAGAVLAAIGTIAYGVVLYEKSHQFATQGTQTYPQAKALLSGGGVAALQYAGLLGSLLLAVGFVLVALNAMRVGLLTRFLGYLGIAAAAASLLLIGSAPALLLEVAWLLAVAYLLAGRWPNGDPPAWHRGEAVPWPSSAEMREQRQRAAGRGRPSAKPAKQPPKQVEPPRREPVAAASPSTRSTTPKRKRKRRK
ncbi:MAG TPA: hypothetical protein VKR21_10380 [Solirubrobacteraceae bacterium]|nr:hypothetical protein [Solirubrobacteraceae bacterium]